MNCPRCGIPVEPDDRQCTVCGEILNDISPGADKLTLKNLTSTRRAPGGEPRLEDLEDILANTLDFTRFGIWWMVACGAFGIISLIIAYMNYSTEAMWAAVIAGALFGLPMLAILASHLLKVTFVFKREVMMLIGIAGMLAGVYLLAKGIERSHIKVETAGMQQLATNEHFTKTLMTLIICGCVLLALIPVTRTVIRGMALRSGNLRNNTDTDREKHTRSNENMTSVELRRLELEHEVQMRKLDLEQEKLKLEAQRTAMLEDNRRRLLTHEDSATSGNTAKSRDEVL